MSESVKLPGFRFHPTEEELLNFYLKGMVYGKKMSGDVIGFLNIYNYDPTELPRMAKIGEREWYFFVPRDRKHGSGGRPNRTTENGFWKATGSDRPIMSVSDPKKKLGLRKTLVFYQGRAPRGRKTHWIMNEYRLPPNNHSCSATAPKDIVLCKIYMKATSLKVLEQRAATSTSTSTATADSPSFCSMELKTEEMALAVEETSKGVRPCSHPNILPELQLPKFPMDWTQDSFWTQLSPWLDNFTPFLPMC